MKKDIKQLQQWADAYYNNEPIVSDEVYDAEYDRLKKLYPNDDFFNTVGAKVKNDVVQLKNVMGSLNKENPESILDWVSKYPNERFLISPKFDGLSLKVVYENGERVQLLTRGNGFEGQDITSRAKYIGGIPRYINCDGHVEVNGECICYKSLFQKYYAKEYKSPRNFCVGTLRPGLNNDDFKDLLKEDEDLCHKLRCLQFIVFSVNNGKKWNKDSKYSLMLDMQVEGFSTILRPARRWKATDQDKYKDNELDVSCLARCKQDVKLPFKNLLTQDKLTTKFFRDAIDAVKAQLDVGCDGIVIELDNLKRAKKLGLEANGLNPKASRAVKHLAFDQNSKQTIIKDIEWNISKRGNYIPTIVVKPIELEGALISRVTGNNIVYLQDMGLGIGARVRMVRSGDVIPRIVETLSTSDKYNNPTKCPYCGTKLKQNDANIYCPNKECEGIKIKKLISFFEIAKVDFMSYSTVSLLVESGYDTVKKIMTITPKKLMQLEGFQETKANKIYNGIQEMKDSVSLAQLMHASGFFDNETTSLGITKLQWIIDYLGVDNIVEDKITNKANDLTKIKGISATSAYLFLAGYKYFASWYKQNKSLFNLTDFNEVEDGPLTGMIFCWTGFRDKNLKQLIEENGGVIKDNLTKDCNVLFSAGDSSKTKRATDLGIKIIPSGKAISYITKLI